MKMCSLNFDNSDYSAIATRTVSEYARKYGDKSKGNGNENICTRKRSMI